MPGRWLRSARWIKHANDEKMGCHWTGLGVSLGLVSFIAAEAAPESSLHCQSLEPFLNITSVSSVYLLGRNVVNCFKCGEIQSSGTGTLDQEFKL